MAESNFRAHYNMSGKTQCIDFSIPNGKVNEETKTETAQNLIKEKHPDYSGKTLIITKVDVFE